MFSCIGIEMTFDELFGMVKKYTIEETGILEFFAANQEQFRYRATFHSKYRTFYRDVVADV
jgi:hypothetical protein